MMMRSSIERLVETLRCPGCRGPLTIAGPSRDQAGINLECQKCHERFPVVNEIPRMLLTPMREALAGQGPASDSDERQVKTAQSFGYEWTRFPEMYAEWEQSFLNYISARTRLFPR